MVVCKINNVLGVKLENTVQQIVTKRKPKSGRPKKVKDLTVPPKYITYRKARTFARKLKIPSSTAWKVYAHSTECPTNIPVRPDLVYKHWKGWNDFLGTMQYVPYEEAKKLVQKHQFLSCKHFRDSFHSTFAKPYTIPPNPVGYYGTSWMGWLDFLGIEKTTYRIDEADRARRSELYKRLAPTVGFKKQTHYRPFMEAVKYISTLGLRDSHEWLKWRGQYKGKDLPWRPDEVYDKDWQGWAVWLGHDALPGIMADTGVLYMARPAGEPSNVFIIDVDLIGKSNVIHRQAREGFKVVRMWKYESEARDLMLAAIRANATPWYGSNKQWLVSNVAGVLYDMMNVLMPIGL